MIRISHIAITAATAMFAHGVAVAEQKAPKGASIKASIDDMLLVAPDDLKFGAAPPVLRPGAEVALLDGKPDAPDRLFGLRIKMPAGYRIMPHWHPADEHVTVISGEVRVGDGKKFEREGMKTLGAGGYFVMPARHVHYIETTEETILQLHGVGPWELNYVNPADDPRREKQQQKQKETARR